jgi:hypothetical protein
MTCATSQSPLLHVEIHRSMRMQDGDASRAQYRFLRFDLRYAVSEGVLGTIRVASWTDGEGPSLSQVSSTDGACSSPLHCIERNGKHGSRCILFWGNNSNSDGRMARQRKGWWWAFGHREGMHLSPWGHSSAGARTKSNLRFSVWKVTKPTEAPTKWNT